MTSASAERGAAVGESFFTAAQIASMETGTIMARWLMIAGMTLLLLGALLHFAPWLLHWFGRLPRGRVFIPLTSMLLVSIVLTLLINLFRR
jgi:uncharacterized membrane protein